MKVLNFGSLNFDHVYETDHFTQPAETQASVSYHRGFGGKGLNQSIALAKAGVEIYHAGRIGKDGHSFKELLEDYGVHTDLLVEAEDEVTGHAIIEVSGGQNRILLHGGANQNIDEKQIEETLKYFDSGDVLLVQNEISNMAYLLERAHEKGMKICFNCAPMNESVFSYPLDCVDLFLVNEIEGAMLGRCTSTEAEDILDALHALFADKAFVLTLGDKGAVYMDADRRIVQEAFKVNAVDSTAAGDTFTGYYLAYALSGKSEEESLLAGCVAGALAVGRMGAASSIPSKEEVEEALINGGIR